ncbi:hypothetical protein E3N88_26014 [Mikania micrantha]|uniref:TF-B3 domain-containing protein n=1 Tax=Mikania micrantha TaxID=192012 RepID=A0A5N6N6C0_9ASTR|nr:hypothetical protein E3N88_26014 [Mikania micrantha]
MTVVDPSLNEQIFVNAKPSPGLIKIQTLAGLSWIVNLVCEEAAEDGVVMFVRKVEGRLSSDDSVEDTTGLVESRLADILYNSESSERFNSEKPLSVSFKNIVSSARIQPGYFKIQTKVGLSWLVKLVKEDDNYLFIEGWKVLVDQLNLILGSYNLFEYEGIPTFTITIYSQQQALHVGNSFYTIMLNRQNDEVLIPTTFLSKNYEGKVPPSFIKLQAEFRILFNMEDVYFKLSGIQALLPLEPNEKCGYGDDKDEWDDVIVFARDVESRMRLPIGVVRALVKSGERRIRMRFEEGEVNEFQVKVTDRKDPRYVVEGWKEFMLDNDIEKNQLCRFKFYKSKLLMVVTKLKEMFSV